MRPGASHRLDVGLSVFDQLERRRAVLQQPIARRGRLRAAPAPLEQRRAKQMFCCADGPGDHRLAHVEDAARLVKASRSGYGFDHPDLFQAETIQSVHLPDIIKIFRIIQ